MPKGKPFEKGIDALYKRKAVDLLLFGFIQGAQASLGTMTTEEATLMFYKVYELTENDYPVRSAMRAIDRMRIEFIETMKSN